MTAAYDRLTRERTLLADEVRRLELERLDQLQLGLWLKACKGDVSAVLGVLRIMQRRAKLLGRLHHADGGRHPPNRR